MNWRSIAGVFALAALMSGACATAVAQQNVLAPPAPPVPPLPPLPPAPGTTDDKAAAPAAAAQNDAAPEATPAYGPAPRGADYFRAFIFRCYAGSIEMQEKTPYPPAYYGNYYFRGWKPDWVYPLPPPPVREYQEGEIEGYFPLGRAYRGPSRLGQKPAQPASDPAKTKPSMARRRADPAAPR